MWGCGFAFCVQLYGYIVIVLSAATAADTILTPLPPLHPQSLMITRLITLQTLHNMLLKLHILIYTITA